MQQLNPPARGSVERGTAARPLASADALGSELSNHLPPDVKWQTQQVPNDALQQPRGGHPGLLAWEENRGNTRERDDKQISTLTPSHRPLCGAKI